MRIDTMCAFLAAALMAATTAPAARAASSTADDQVFPVTVQIPYGFLFLHVPTFSAAVPPLHGWQFDIVASSGNNFVFSDNVAHSLAARSSRVPMTKAEFDGIVATHPGEDVYYIDDQVSSVTARFGATVAPSVFVGGIVSVVRVGGGAWMDGIIENFHENFGFPAMYRDVVPHGQATTAIHIGSFDAFLDPSVRTGMSDPIVFVRWTPERRFSAWSMSVVAGAKVPIASTSKLLSTGSADFGAAYAATGDFGRWCVNLNAGVAFPGNVDSLGGLDAAPMFGVATSLGVKLDSVSFWLEFQGEQSPFRTATASHLGEGVADLALGMRFPMGGRVRGFFAFTENLVALENSTDIAFHFGVTWRTRPK